MSDTQKTAVLTIVLLTTFAVGGLFANSVTQAGDDTQNIENDYNITNDVYENISTTDVNVTSIYKRNTGLVANISIVNKNQSEIFNDIGQVAGAYAAAEIKTQSENYDLVLFLRTGDGGTEARFRINSSWPDLLQAGEINRTEYALKVLRTYNSSV